MKRALKILGLAVAVVLVAAMVALGWLYATFCTGHPHGMC
jgi:hypothetical protein